MTEQFKKEIKIKIAKQESLLNELTCFWMDGKFTHETNHRIGRSIDFINKSIDELKKLLK